MPNRINEIQKEFKKLGLAALFVTNQENVSLLAEICGETSHEREIFFVITQKRAYLLTYPTYFGLYEKGGKNYKTLPILRPQKISDVLKKILEDENLRVLGFENENLTVSELASLKKAIPAKFIGTFGIVEKLRLIKTEAEIQNIKEAATVTDRAFEFIETKIDRGISEKEIALELEFFLKKNAGDIAFSPIVAFNEHAAIPHYLPSHNSQLTTHNLILLDFGAKVNGYCADMTRVLFFGTPKDVWVKIYETVKKSQELALENVKPKIPAATADKVAREYIKSADFPDYPHGLGHGVGLSIHEAPRLRYDSGEILAENMVVTVEPGIYLPGEAGVRIEDLVVLKRDGIEMLSKSPKTLKEMIL